MSWDRLEARVLALAEQPRMGPRRSDLRPTMRVLVESPYLILYETHPDSEAEPVQRVEIVRVIDSRRDVAKVLE
jgi:toxin ParE1/3/4